MKVTLCDLLEASADAAQRDLLEAQRRAFDAPTQANVDKARAVEISAGYFDCLLAVAAQLRFRHEGEILLSLARGGEGRPTDPLTLRLAVVFGGADELPEHGGASDLVDLEQVRRRINGPRASQ